MSHSNPPLLVRKRYRLLTRLAPFLALLPIRLPAILQLSGSDKERPGGHHYGAAYQKLFRGWKYKALTLMEIGIGGYNKLAGGESLAAWSCYFLFAKIVGCDI